MFGLIAYALASFYSLEQSPEQIRDRFVQRVAECGVTAPYVPGVSEQSARPMIYYSDTERTVFYPVWSGVDPTGRLLLAGDAASARAWFDDAFLSLLIPHELGHWLEMINDRHIDHWSSELQANRIALAFWRRETGDDALLHRRLSAYWAPLDKVPSPVPEGHTISEWFNSAPFNPATYGWYQGRMMQLSWTERDTQDFCDLVREATRPPAA